LGGERKREVKCGMAKRKIVSEKKPVPGRERKKGKRSGAQTKHNVCGRKASPKKNKKKKRGGGREKKRGPKVGRTRRFTT